MYSENFISKKLKTFAEKNEWLISGEYIYGEEQGVLFSGLDGKGEKTFITPVPGITEDQKSELFDVLEDNKSTMKMTDYTISDDFLCIRIKDSMQLKTDDIEFILALLVGSLQELGIVTVGRCQECGKMGADTENFVCDLYCYMHEECAKALEDGDDSCNEKSSYDDETNDSNEDSDEDSDEETDSETGLNDDNVYQVPMIKKILFTVSGAVIGSIPWLLLPYIMDVVNDLIAKVTESTLVANFTQSLLTCICAYLVSYFAIVGYRLSKAKMDIKGRWVVGIVSIAVVVILQFVSLAILIIKEPTVNLTISNYISNISKSNFYINMLLGALIGIVFTLIAVLPFFDNSSSSAKTKKDFLSKKKSTNVDSTEDETDVNETDENSNTNDSDIISEDTNVEPIEISSEENSDETQK